MHKLTKNMLWESSPVLSTTAASVHVRKNWSFLKTQPSVRKLMINIQIQMSMKINGVPKVCRAQSCLVPLRSSRGITEVSTLSSSIRSKVNPASPGDQN